MTELASNDQGQAEGIPVPDQGTTYADKGPGFVSGNLTKDPELRFTPQGRPIVTARVAISERVRDQGSGEWRDGPTVFRDVVAWGGLAERICEHLAKGDRIVACGRWQLQTWTAPDGTAREAMKLTARDLGPSMLFLPASIDRAAEAGR